MRLALYRDRAVLVTGHSDDEARVVDLAGLTAGRFGPDPMVVLDSWDEFTSWSFPDALDLPEGQLVPLTELGPPVPRPLQVFAIGMNYRDHAREIDVALPSQPSVFTKYPTCLAGPRTTLALPVDTLDWEVELVVVIGRAARHVDAAHAWDHVAGLTVGQDLSDRALQFADDPPQFSLAKSSPGFGPTGPWLTTPDELVDRDDLAISSEIDGTTKQSSRTSQLIFPVAELVAYLSGVLPLLPGDLIFTGTPSGVGHGRTPREYLRPGNVLTSTVEGLGSLRQAFVES